MLQRLAASLGISSFAIGFIRNGTCSPNSPSRCYWAYEDQKYSLIFFHSLILWISYPAVTQTKTESLHAGGRDMSEGESSRDPFKLVCVVAVLGRHTSLRGFASRAQQSTKDRTKRKCKLHLANPEERESDNSAHFLLLQVSISSRCSVPLERSAGKRCL